MPTRTSAFRSRTFLRVLVLRERLAPQAMWWNRGGDYAPFLSAFSPERDSLLGFRRNSGRGSGRRNKVCCTTVPQRLQ